MIHTHTSQRPSTEPCSRLNGPPYQSRARVLVLCLAGLAIGWLHCARADTHVWSGAVNSYWSTPGNWTNGTAPSTGDALVFPAAPVRSNVTNDYASGTTFDDIAFEGTYTVGGNTIGLRASLVVSYAGARTIHAPLSMTNIITVIVYSTGQTLTLEGPISGSGGLQKWGYGTLVLAGGPGTANTYTGSTTVYIGKLRLAKTIPNSAISGNLVIDYAWWYYPFSAVVELSGVEQIQDNAAVTIRQHGTNGLACLDLNGVASETIGSLEGDRYYWEDASLEVKLQAGRLIVGSNGQSSTFRGQINGTGGLTKVGPGTLTLKDSNTYTGATEVQGGTLLVDGYQPQSAVSVAIGATLGGSGRVGDLTCTGGIVAPGASPSGLTCGNLVFSPGSTFQVELANTNSYDWLVVQGTCQLGGASLSVQPGFDPPEGSQFIILDRAQAGPISGTFAALSEGDFLVATCTKFRISYVGGSGNQVVLTTIAVPPTIPSQPQNQTVAVGQSATFSVGACGTPPRSYQWRFNTAPLSGATSSSLTLNNVQTTNAGSYTVVVANSTGSITSAVAVLTVIEPPTIASQPQNRTVAVGQSATLSVGANGTPPLSYQWRFNTAPLSGATSSSLTLNDVQTTNAGSYTVVVTNSAGSITSAVAVLTVIEPPTIVSQPQNRTVTMGQSATFSVGANGTPPLSYQWRFNTAPLSGATSSSLTLNNAQTTNAGSYTVVVTNSAGGVISSVATLTVLTPEIGVVVAGTNLMDGVSTVSFGTNQFGQTGPTLTFTVTNAGGATWRWGR